MANRIKQPVYTHIAETKREVDECYERYHVSPFGFLDSIGMFEYGGGGFHGVWMSEKDQEICQKKKISIVSNPSSNLKLASGIADLCGLLEKGINVALGTDGPASNNALDMFREMYLASVLPKVTKQDASAMDAAAVLKMSTVGGSKAMRYAVRRKVRRSDHDRYAPPEHAAGKQYSEKYRVQRQQGKCEADDGRR